MVERVAALTAEAAGTARSSFSRDVRPGYPVGLGEGVAGYDPRTKAVRTLARESLRCLFDADRLGRSRASTAPGS